MTFSISYTRKQNHSSGKIKKSVRTDIMNLRKEETEVGGRKEERKGEKYKNDIPTSANQLITNPFS